VFAIKRQLAFCLVKLHSSINAQLNLYKDQSNPTNSFVTSYNLPFISSTMLRSQALFFILTGVAVAGRFHKRQDRADLRQFNLFAYNEDIGGLPVASNGGRSPRSTTAAYGSC
jgi:hypothetical protein